MQCSPFGSSQQVQLGCRRACVAHYISQSSPAGMQSFPAVACQLLDIHVPCHHWQVHTGSRSCLSTVGYTGALLSLAGTYSPSLPGNTVVLSAACRLLEFCLEQVGLARCGRTSFFPPVACRLLHAHSCLTTSAVGAAVAAAVGFCLLLHGAVIGQ